MAGTTVLGLWDYAAIILVLLISSLIGLYYRFTGGKQRTMQEYLLADKNMSITPVAFSLMASFMSAISILGVASENYTFGFQFIVINIAYSLLTPVAAYLYLPVFFNLQATSAYEYLELRFGKTARIAASLFYTLQMTLYMGIVLYAPALALEALTGISKEMAILTIGIVCIFYSCLGGMKAVLMTDVLQSLLMFASVFCIIGYGLKEHGSLAEIWRIAEKGNRTSLLNFDPDPTVRHSWFSLIIGGGVTYLSLYAVNQTQVQRYLTMKDLSGAQKALWWNVPILSLLSLCTSFAGLTIYARYRNCDPVSSGLISTTDQLMPYYVIDTMKDLPGLTGLFVAGIFSASLSTVSAALNSLAAVTFEDYYKPLYKMALKKDPSETGASYQTKIMALVYGVICLGVAFLAQLLGGVLQAALTIFGVVGGPLLGLFTLGMFTFTANEGGAVTGLFAGVMFALWMAFGSKPPLQTLPVSVEGCKDFKTIFSDNYSMNLTTSTKDVHINDTGNYLWIHRVSYLYNGVAGLLITLIVGYLVSFILRIVFKTPVKDEKYKPELFVPPIANRMRREKEENIKMTIVNGHK